MDDHSRQLGLAQARISNLESALRLILAKCPDNDPGSAEHPMGGWRSEGNSDDIARDCVNEALWKVAVIAREALNK